jgi:hypothetical protein
VDPTRIIQLDPHGLRQDAANDCTLVGASLGPSSTASFQGLFTAHYAEIRRICEAHPQQGLVMIACGPGDAFAWAFLRARAETAAVAILGRHGGVDLYLPHDPSLSLRHLVVLLHPAAPGEEPSFRLLDMRTPTAFLDEHGNRLEALLAEGPVFVRCAGWAIFFLPTGDGLPWPESPADGWECIPERIYQEEQPAEPDRWQRRRPLGRQLLLAADASPPRPGARNDARTAVQILQGPALAGPELLAPGEAPLGRLDIETAEASAILTVGASALHRGILLGRYERCDSPGVPILIDSRISRVHLLLVEIAGVPYAVDMASTNGLWLDDALQRLVPLQPGRPLGLGRDLATLRWRPVG